MLSPQAQRRAVGRRIQEELDDRGLSHADLARQIGRDPSSVSRIISGAADVRATLLYAVAAALGIEPGALLPPLSAPPPRARSLRLDALEKLTAQVEALRAELCKLHTAYSGLS